MKGCLLRVLGVLAVLAQVLPTGCGEDTGVLEPSKPPELNHGTTITGIAQIQGGAPEAGIVVTLERVEAGVSATVRLLSKQAARKLAEGGPLDSGAFDEMSLAEASGVRATVTDENGRYAFHDVEAGDYVITAKAGTHLAGISDVTVPCVNGSASGACEVPVDLLPTGTFNGVCTLESTDNYWGTIVYVAGTSYLAVTDPLGKYKIDFVPLGRHRVTATHIGYIDQSLSGWLLTEGETITFPDIMLLRDRNISPTAIIAGSAIVGTIIYPIDLVGSGMDPDGTIVLYEWDFEDDGIVDWSSNETGVTSHRYNLPGTYRPKLTVTDDKGAIGLAVGGPVEIADATCAYVSAATGSDGNAGTWLAPFATITKALQTLASTTPAFIFVDNGVYDENLVLLPGISINGGNDASTWARIPGQYTLITPYEGGVWADGVGNAVITGLEIRSDNAPPNASTYAMRLANCPSSLRFIDCRFASGNGGWGSNGSHGGPGRAGGRGGDGGSGECDIEVTPGFGGSAGSSHTCNGGKGGTGGYILKWRGGTGSANGCGGPMGGAGGVGGKTGGNGTPGSAGTIGTDGTDGAAASAAGYTAGASWYPYVSGNGTIGTNGTGGAGGGGSGGQVGLWVINGAGNGGGGGGGGGEHGTAGTGGYGGGGSFAVLLYNSSVVFDGCFFASGNGGTGGAGGNGGNAGAGGSKGIGWSVCSEQIGAGGNGGAGGRGGRGGAGAGGSGGLSYGVYKILSSPTLLNPNYFIGSGGAGGQGGYKGWPLTGQATSGSTGLRGNMN